MSKQADDDRVPGPRVVGDALRATRRRGRGHSSVGGDPLVGVGGLDPIISLTVVGEMTDDEVQVVRRFDG